MRFWTVVVSLRANDMALLAYARLGLGRGFRERLLHSVVVGEGKDAGEGARRRGGLPT